MVGAVGFVTDFSVLYVAVALLGLGTVIGRILSFVIAATVTWKINRRFTFVQSGKGGGMEWLRYLLFTSVGGAINLAVYQTWLYLTSHTTLNLFIGVAAGSAVALVFNFAISKRAVFTNQTLVK